MHRHVSRLRILIPRLIEEFELDLRGLTVYTEAASGPYLYTPILAAMAGATVYARTRDSRFASKEDVRANTERVAKDFGVENRLRVRFERDLREVSQADIITNTGFVRPIDAKVVACLKPTAVVPLMWETWEYRGDEVDLSACKERGILVLGTDESRPPHAMDPYPGMLTLRLLFDLGLEGYKTRVLLVGGELLGRRIANSLAQYGVEFTWFADGEDSARPLDEFGIHFLQFGRTYDAIVLAELVSHRRLVGDDGILTVDQIEAVNPDIRLGVIAGNVDAEALSSSRLTYLPPVIASPGYMSYQLYDLGPRPILELYAAGLKVGEVMARARLAGVGIAETIAIALRDSPAMDFKGGHAWIQN